MPLEVGQQAPDFTLVDTERKERSLKEFLGKKTILAFYPGAFTGVCTKEMCALRDTLANLNDAGAQVVGISVDAPAANRAFKEQNRLGFPLLSDVTHAVSRKYPGLYESFGGVKGLETAKRSIFVLDPGGTVRYAWTTENPGEEPDYDAVRSAVRTI